MAGDADLGQPVAMEHHEAATLDAGLREVRRAPKDDGHVELIVGRPAVDERSVLTEATLDSAAGLVGDTWHARGSRHTEDGSAEAGRQLTLMNARAAALIAGSRDRWPLAGDQLYVDLDLGGENLPAGTRLAIGSAVVEISGLPHTGCAKFAARFGKEALRFVNSDAGRALNLRGVNATIVRTGVVRPGDVIRKVAP